MNGTATSTDGWGLVTLPHFADERGALAVIEAGQQVSFPIERVYFLYDAPPRTVRGGHVHRSLEQLLIAVSGSLEAIVDDGSRRETIRLDDPSRGLYIGPMVWRHLANFTPDAVCLVLASTVYDASDYGYDYDAFLREVRR